MNPEFITQVALALISILGAGVTYLLIPWIKTKLTADKLAQIVSIVTIAVKAAEQMFVGAGLGKLKKEFVLEFIRDKGVKITDTQLDAIIEALVYEVNLERRLKVPDNKE